MFGTVGSRAAALLVAAVAMVAAPTALAQTPTTGGRKGQEFRLTISKHDRRIPVVMVSRDEVNRPVAGALQVIPPESAGVVPSFGGGMTRPPAPGAGASSTRPGDSLFNELVTPGANPYRDPATPPVTRSGAVDVDEGAAVQHTDPDRQPRSQDGRPVVRVVSGGSGRVHVMPSGGYTAPAAGVASGTTPSTTAPPTAGLYRIGAGDVLDVFVWRNPDLSRQLPVRPDGLISLPLVGEVQAAGLTAEELQGQLSGRLADFIQQPTVTVTVTEIRSLVVYVLGNVNSPGTVVMDRNLTTLQAIAMAGGLNEFADRNDIVVLRTDPSGAQRRYSFRYDDVVGGKDLGTNLLLQAGDVIYVP